MVIFDPALGTLELSNEYWGVVGEFNDWGGKPEQIENDFDYEPYTGELEEENEEQETGVRFVPDEA